MELSREQELLQLEVRLAARALLAWPGCACWCKPVTIHAAVVPSSAACHSCSLAQRHPCPAICAAVRAQPQLPTCSLAACCNATVAIPATRNLIATR
jgi:hypothetical protein